MSMAPDDQQLAERAKALLDAEAQALDAGSRARLRQARMAALAQLDAPAPDLRWRPALAMAAGIGVVGLAALLWLNTPTGVPTELADLELLAADEDLEFYDELDFYVWLHSSEPSGGQADHAG